MQVWEKAKARVTAREPTWRGHLLPLTASEKKITKQEQVKSGADWNIFEKLLAKARRSK